MLERLEGGIYLLDGKNKKLCKRKTCELHIQYVKTKIIT